MLDKKNLVSTMIQQHRTLQKEVGSVLEILKTDVDTEKISQGLEQFKKDLIEHLKLENDVFYAELLKEMKSKGQDTTKTEQFIAEMKNIEKAVVAFLGKYDSSEDIKEKLEEFKKEFAGIVDTLTLRIESEESGVFAYWGLF